MQPVVFIGLAAGLAAWACAAASLWVRAPCLYAAFSFALVAAAHGLKRPGWFMKRPDGTIRPVAWLLLGPYFAAGAGLLRLRWLIRPSPAWSQVVPGLYLGRQLSRREARRRLTFAPRAVIDLACEFAEPHPLRASPGYLLLPVLDDTAPALEQLRIGTGHIAAHLPAGAVYVHCAAGRGRSACLAAAYLLRAGLAQTAEEALELVRGRREGIRLNKAQLQVLAQFADELARANAQPASQAEPPG